MASSSKNNARDTAVQVRAYFASLAPDTRRILKRVREIFQTGTWVLADCTPLPADLEVFLESGEPPILVGFGSMPAPADASRRLIRTAIGPVPNCRGSDV